MLSDITEVKITNLQGQPLGRISEIAVDLTNGRVVEVLVVYDQTLRLGGKTVAVPPRALIQDAQNKVYQINISLAAFKDAPKFDLSKWADSTQLDKVVAAYHYFSQEPNFLMSGEAPGRLYGNGREVTSLGYVERMSKLIGMDVADTKGAIFGKLESLVMDVPDGVILNTQISARTGNTPLKFSTVIPATLLNFTADRKNLVLDVTKVEYAEEPHVIFAYGAGGQVISTREQAATTPHTSASLVQGTSFRDISITSKIYQGMDADNEGSYGVEVATLEGRVTLRGQVSNPGTKVSIGAIAIGQAKLENVDNQITVASDSAVFPASESPPPAVLAPAQSSL